MSSRLSWTALSAAIILMNYPLPSFATVHAASSPAVQNSEVLAAYGTKIQIFGGMIRNDLDFVDGLTIDLYSPTNRTLVVSMNNNAMTGRYVSGSTGEGWRAISGYSYKIQTNDNANDLVARIAMPYDPSTLSRFGIDTGNTYVGKMGSDGKSWTIDEDRRNVQRFRFKTNIEKLTSIDGEYRHLGRTGPQSSNVFVGFGQGPARTVNFTAGGRQDVEFVDGLRFSVVSDRNLTMNVDFLTTATGKGITQGLPKGMSSLYPFAYIVNTTMAFVPPNAGGGPLIPGGPSVPASVAASSASSAASSGSTPPAVASKVSSPAGSAAGAGPSGASSAAQPTGANSGNSGAGVSGSGSGTGAGTGGTAAGSTGTGSGAGAGTAGTGAGTGTGTGTGTGSGSGSGSGTGAGNGGNGAAGTGAGTGAGTSGTGTGGSGTGTGTGAAGTGTGTGAGSGSGAGTGAGSGTGSGNGSGGLGPAGPFGFPIPGVVPAGGFPGFPLRLLRRQAESSPPPVAPVASPEVSTAPGISAAPGVSAAPVVSGPAPAQTAGSTLLSEPGPKSSIASAGPPVSARTSAVSARTSAVSSAGSSAGTSASASIIVPLPPLSSVASSISPIIEPKPTRAPPATPTPPSNEPPGQVNFLQIQFPINMNLLRAMNPNSVNSGQVGESSDDLDDEMLRSIPFQLGRRDVGSFNSSFAMMPIASKAANGTTNTGMQLTIVDGRLQIAANNIPLDGEYVILVPSSGLAEADGQGQKKSTNAASVLGFGMGHITVMACLVGLMLML